MKSRNLSLFRILTLSLAALTPWIAQVSTAQQAATAVPTLVKYSAALTDLNGKPLRGVVGVTFLLYKDEQGGAPLWMEIQNVTPDKNGHYTVVLGSMTAQGLPTDLFASGEARWLGVQAQGQPEQPRVLLLSVPYALKAGDAQTVGGLPPSAFVLATPAGNNTVPAADNTTTPAATASASPLTTSNVTTTGGTANTIPLFTTATNIQNSAMSQTGSGATAKIGIGTTAPAATLDVKGGADIRGLLSLPAIGTATATKGFNSEPNNFVTSVFNKGTSTAVAQTFQLQAEPVGNDTSTASGTLNFLYGSGTASPAETGLKISNKGLLTFATGQTFPGTGTGTVKSVGLSAPASDFTVSGSPVTTSGTLNIAWNVAPTSADTANAIVKRDASGNFSAGAISAGNLNATDVTVTNFLNVLSSANVTIDANDSSSDGTAVEGIASAASGSAWGGFGRTNSSASSAYGVYGLAASSSGSPIGVYGFGTSTTSPGVFGQNGTESSTGTNLVSALSVGGSGVWGDGGTAPANGNVGVIGTVDDGNAAVFENSSPTGYYTVYIHALNTETLPFIAVTGLGGFCNVDNNGNLNCTGAKNAVVPIDGGKRTVAMSAIESPKNWFEDFGSAELVNGVAVVALDPDFIQTVNTEMPYQVFPVPNGDCRGLYATHKTATSFEVRELGGGASNVSSDYRITALRRKYENVRFADHTHDLDSLKRMQERARAAGHKGPVSHMPAKNIAVMHPAMHGPNAPVR